MLRDQHHSKRIKYDRRIVISPSGEYKTEYQAQKVVQSAVYELPVPTITKMDLLRELLYPDSFEFGLIGASFLLNVILANTIIGLSVFNPNMIVFWGIINFILSTTRWAYWGPIHYAARLKMIDEELMKGNVVVDFKFFGILVSLILVAIGVILA